MTERSQSQRAGSNSQQVQIFGNVNMAGVTEERAREISRESFRDLFAQYSQESQRVAFQRVEKLDEEYVKQLAEDGLLEALADPAFQVTLRKAQLGAASTEREADYELLSGLLQDRAARPGSRHVRAGINRAVEIVDQLDDDALTGLSVFSVADTLYAAGNSIATTLDTMDRLLQQVMDGRDLPAGSEWLEHLEILDAVRIDPVQSFVKFDKFWSMKFSSWLSEGVVAGSEEDIRGQSLLEGLGTPKLVIPHELKPGYNMFAADMAIHFLRNPEKADLLEQALAVGRDIYRTDQTDDNLIPPFMDQVRQRPFQQELGEWWGTLTNHFSLTAVGKVLTRANVKNLDKHGMLPVLW